MSQVVLVLSCSKPRTASAGNVIRSLSRIWLPELQNTKHVLFNNVGILVLKGSKMLELAVF